MRGALPKCGDDSPKGRAGRVGIGRVVADIGMRGIEALGRRVDVIPALGHGHRHDADRGIGHALDQWSIAFDDWRVVDHRPHDLDRTAGGIKLDQGCQIVLRRHLQALCLVKGPYARAHDRPVMRLRLLHQPVQIPGLVTAVEVAEADMDDAGREFRAVIGRHQDVFGQLAQIGVAEFHRARHQLIQLPPSTFNVCAVM